MVGGVKMAEPRIFGRMIPGTSSLLLGEAASSQVIVQKSTRPGAAGEWFEADEPLPYLSGFRSAGLHWYQGRVICGLLGRVSISRSRPPLSSILSPATVFLSILGICFVPELPVCALLRSNISAAPHFVSSLIHLITFSTIQLGLGCFLFAAIDSTSSSIMGFASFPPSVRKTTTGLRPPAYNYNCSAPHWRLHFDSFFLYHTIGPWMFPLCYGPDSIHRICFVPAFRPHDNRRRVPSCTPVYPRYSTLVPSFYIFFSTIQLGVGCVLWLLATISCTRHRRRHSPYWCDNLLLSLWDLLRSRLTGVRPPAFKPTCETAPCCLCFRNSNLFVLYHPIGRWVSRLRYGSDSISWD